MNRFVFVKLAVAVALVCGLAGSASAQLSGILSGETPAPKPIDTDRAAMTSPETVKSLPRLGSEFTILAPSGKTFNAFAHVIGVADRWIDVKTGSPESPFSEMDRHLSSAGYRRTEGLDVSHRQGVKKVIVYGTVKPDGDVLAITAAAVQLADGTWSSKVGSMAVIGFARPAQLTGTAYGTIVAVYERQDSRPSPFAVR